MSLAGRLRKLELASQKRRHERGEKGMIRTWLCFVLFCEGGPEAERRFGPSPRYHPDIERFFLGVADDVENWARENHDLAGR